MLRYECCFPARIFWQCTVLWRLLMVLFLIWLRNAVSIGTLMLSGKYWILYIFNRLEK